MSEQSMIEDRIRASGQSLEPSAGFDDRIEERIGVVRRRRQRTRAALAGLSVLLVIVGLFAVADRAGDDDAPTAARTGDRPLVWKVLAAPTLSERSDPVLVWAGDLLFVWGGNSAGSNRHGVRDDGALYDPAADRWRSVPEGPLGPRAAAAGVWTGTEVIVWGGLAPSDAPFESGAVEAAPDAASAGHRDGAAFDPVTGDWRLISPAPISGRLDAAVVWTGSEMLVLGGQATTADGANTIGAAYDPTNDTWRLLPDLGYQSSAAAGAAMAGDEALFWRSAETGGSQTPLVDVHHYNPEVDSWSGLPSIGQVASFADASHPLLWSAHGLLAIHHIDDENHPRVTVRSLDPSQPQPTWQTLIDTSDQLRPARATHHWNGREVLTVDLSNGTVAALDPATGAQELHTPPEPVRPAATVAGSSLYLYADDFLAVLTRG